MKSCDGNIQGVFDVIDTRTFVISTDGAFQKWTLDKKLGTGVYGATFLATSNPIQQSMQAVSLNGSLQQYDSKTVHNHEVLLNEKAWQSYSVAIKAQLNPNGLEWGHKQQYDMQEYENQHHLACRFNDRLKELHTLKKLQGKTSTYAMFPEVYFIGVYNLGSTRLTLFEKEGIQQSVVAGMEKLEFTLSTTLTKMFKKDEYGKIAELVNKVIVSVANTLQEVNQKNKMYFVHGDLHDGNIMHDESQENFHIIDFGTARITETKRPQLDLPAESFYKSPIAAGSRGLDLMTLCFNLLDFIRKISVQDNDMTEEKGLLSHLWYPLWNFFRSDPTGQYSGKEVVPLWKKKLKKPLALLFLKQMDHFLGVGKDRIYRPRSYWGWWPEVRDKNIIKKLSLAHFYGYTAGDESPKTLAFEPEKILSNDAVNDKVFMEDIRTYFHWVYNENQQEYMIYMSYDVVVAYNERAEESKRAEEAKRAEEDETCIVSYMPQFRTFTLNNLGICYECSEIYQLSE